MQAAGTRGGRVGDDAETSRYMDNSDPLKPTPEVIEILDSDSEDGQSSSSQTNIAIVSVYSQAITEAGTEQEENPPCIQPDLREDTRHVEEQDIGVPDNNNTRKQKFTSADENEMSQKPPYEILYREVKRKLGSYDKTFEAVTKAHSDEVAEWSAKVENRDSKIIEMRKETEKSNVLIRKANNKIQAFKTEIKLKDEQLSNSESEINTLEKENNDLKINVKNIEDEINTLQIENTLKDNKLLSNATKINNLEKKKDELNIAVKNAEQKITTLTNDYETSLEIARVKNVSLVERMSYIAKENKQYESENKKLKQTISDLKQELEQAKINNQKDKVEINRLEDLIILLPLPVEPGEESSEAKDETTNKTSHQKVETADAGSQCDYPVEEKTAPDSPMTPASPTLNNATEAVLIVCSDPEQHTLSDPDTLLPDIQGVVAELHPSEDPDCDQTNGEDKTEQPGKNPEMLHDNNTKPSASPAAQSIFGGVSTRPKRQSISKPARFNSYCMESAFERGSSPVTKAAAEKRSHPAKLASGSPLTTTNAKKVPDAKKRRRTTSAELPPGDEKEQPDLDNASTSDPSGQTGRPRRVALKKPPCACCPDGRGHDHYKPKDEDKEVADRKDSKSNKKGKSKPTPNKRVLPPAKVPPLGKAAVKGETNPKKLKSDPPKETLGETQSPSQVSIADSTLDSCGKGETAGKNINNDSSKPVAQVLPTQRELSLANQANTKIGGLSRKKSVERFRLKEKCPFPPDPSPSPTVTLAVPLETPSDSNEASQTPQSTSEVLPPSEVPKVVDQKQVITPDKKPSEETSEPACTVLPPSSESSKAEVEEAADAETA